MTIEDRFKKGIQFRNDGKLTLAKDTFAKIINDYPRYQKLSVVYTVLGGVYKDLGLVNDAKFCFRNATELNPKSELASLGLYLTLVKSEEYEQAIEELKRYLDDYPAKNYKITLTELLNDLEVGYAGDFKEVILMLAQKNDVRLPLN